jgi:hypothetical protein
MNCPSSLGEDRYRRAVRLLDEAGLGPPLRLSRLAGGANNQVFRVDLAGGAVVLKAYFFLPDDPRDRARAEHGFAQFAWGRGVQALARPVAYDPAGRLALFEHIPGRKLAPEEVTAERVGEAMAFYLAVNAGRGTAEARALPVAAESCFTLAEHLACVDRRLTRLQVIEPTAAVDRNARDFVRDELSVRGENLLRQTADRAAALGLSLDQPLAEEDRCLSPSDFGLHNALLAADDRLRFLDFEYAGWDDPAKMVADFFCQPALPVPPECFEGFAAAVAERTARPELHLRRFRLLLPLNRLKWCCILLNDFLPAGGGRRRFADEGDEEERKRRQLLKARAALRNV